MWQTALVVSWLAVLGTGIRVGRAWWPVRDGAPRPEPAGGLDPVEAGFLTGGAARAAQLAMVRMHRRERLVLSGTAGDGALTGSGPDEGPLEAAAAEVLGRSPHRRLSTVVREVADSPAAHDLELALAERGLLRPADAIARLAAARKAEAVAVALYVTFFTGVLSIMISGASQLLWLLFVVPGAVSLWLTMSTTALLDPVTAAGREGLSVLRSRIRVAASGPGRTLGPDEELTAAALAGVDHLYDRPLREALRTGTGPTA
ncbi:TIGR04222 domain-containing membrane protein [Actinacidiphila alni]|uniref:TIGR04222 domain-containing membrane protein n=1 Tax=Actinacidiphila alni TaxID=380248 RepID=UPI0033E9A346